jgi:hypothetical protein
MSRLFDFPIVPRRDHWMILAARKSALLALQPLHPDVADDFLLARFEAEDRCVAFLRASAAQAAEHRLESQQIASRRQASSELPGWALAGSEPALT